MHKRTPDIIPRKPLGRHQITNRKRMSNHEKHSLQIYSTLYSLGNPDGVYCKFQGSIPIAAPDTFATGNSKINYNHHTSSNILLHAYLGMETNFYIIFTSTLLHHSLHHQGSHFLLQRTFRPSGRLESTLLLLSHLINGTFCHISNTIQVSLMNSSDTNLRVDKASGDQMSQIKWYIDKRSGWRSKDQITIHRYAYLYLYI